MAKLKSEHKVFIVKRLACFESPSYIIKELKKQFDLTISAAQVAYYNPENIQGRLELASKWRKLFSKTREQFISDSYEIPISHKSYRLKQLQKNYERFVDKGKYSKACKVLEQAAKEMGGAYGSNPPRTAPQRDENFYERINKKIIEQNQNSMN